MVRLKKTAEDDATQEGEIHPPPITQLQLQIGLQERENNNQNRVTLSITLVDQNHLPLHKLKIPSYKCQSRILRH